MRRRSSKILRFGEMCVDYAVGFVMSIGGGCGCDTGIDAVRERGNS